jgi:Zn-dependent M16 (insulinase) family peptidase
MKQNDKQAGKQFHPDFQLLREADLPDVRAYAREFEHLPSGARVLHLQTEDSENCFALAFATPPDADHGVPHILEHAVLAGSEKFPVREPFFEMVKSSPAGFINAMTSNLWTVYPICTTLEADFFNLAQVYADAVFRPLLSRETFEREGHHLKLETPGDLESKLVRSGIVYNEMKGAFSYPEASVHRAQRLLFPGGALGFEYGGEPAAIPTLTYEALRDFHSRYYAPANCTLFLYGDIALEKQLAFWGEKFSGHSRQASLAARPQFEEWSTPRRVEDGYNIGAEDELSERTFLSLLWRVGDAHEPYGRTAWQVLARLLAGHDGAPLKRALIASKLGADVMAAYARHAESEMVFHVALKGSERERAEAFQTLVLDTLRAIADEGFEREAIETALRQTAYVMQEVHSLYPLHLSMIMASYACCGGDALEAARGRTYLKQVREDALQDNEFFPRMIREKLLDNPHRLLGVFYPDPQRAARETERETGELEQIKAALSREELQRIDERAQLLEQANGKANSPESIAALPRLSKSDLPAAPREAPSTPVAVAGFTVLKNDVFCNGVAHVQASVDVSDVPTALWKFLPRFGDAFSKMGAAGQSWDAIAARRAACTGWMNGHPRAVLDVQSGARKIEFRFGFNSLEENLGEALDVFADLVFELEAGDRARLLEMQTQSVARLRSHLVADAFGVAMTAAGRAHSPVGPLHYLWKSPLTYAWMKELTDNFSSRADELIHGVESVRDFLRDPNRWTWSFTGDDAAFETLQHKLGSWQERAAKYTRAAASLNSSSLNASTLDEDGARDLPSILGLAAPLDVQFCAQAMPCPAREKIALVDLGLCLLRFDYLLPEIRLKGNAYGAGSDLREEHGTLSLFSYSDPRLNETLQVFEDAPAWVAAQKWTEADIERALLGNARDAIPAFRPLETTGRVLDFRVQNETAVLRAARYQEKLRATPEQVQHALIEYFDDAASRATIAVAASRAALERANAERNGAGKPGFEIEEMLPENLVDDEANE